MADEKYYSEKTVRKMLENVIWEIKDCGENPTTITVEDLEENMPVPDLTIPESEVTAGEILENLSNGVFRKDITSDLQKWVLKAMEEYRALSLAKAQHKKNI